MAEIIAKEILSSLLKKTEAEISSLKKEGVTN